MNTAATKVRSVFAVTFLLVTISILATTAQTQDAARAEYPDVPRGHWANEAVNMLSNAGVIEGLPNGGYGGDKMMRRYEFVVAIARCGTGIVMESRTQAEQEAIRLKQARDLDKRGPNQVEYPDVPRRHWASEAVKVASMMGVIEGLPDDTFGANRPLTRYDCSIALARFLAFRDRGRNRASNVDSEKIEKVVATSYPDVSEIHWAFHAISTLNNLGVFEGFADGKFRGTKPMSRYEFTVAFARVYKLMR